MSSNVVNPSNAPSKSGPAFTTPAVLKAIAKRREKGDAFNTSKEYPDEGAFPFFEGVKATDVNRHPPACIMVPGLGERLTAEDIKALSRPDELSQGQHTRFVERAIIVDVDAKIITNAGEIDQLRKGIFREAHFPSIQDWISSPYFHRLRESNLILRNVINTAKKTIFRESGGEASDIKGVVLDPRLASKFKTMDNALLKRLRESGKLKEAGLTFDGGPADTFSLDTTPVQTLDVSMAGRDVDFIPIMSGPYNKQLYWTDYLDMHSKCFEAWNHNPIAKRICKVITQFVLGKGVRASVVSSEYFTDETVTQKDAKGQDEEFDRVIDYREETQEILDEHWAKNNMILRSKMILRDLIIFGEQFPRYFRAPWGLKVRQIDPSTVWEVVTDPDDAENEFYIHQQYPTRYQWYVQLPIPTIKYIIRQVPALNYYHMKINTVAGEVRGRSELFAILGWLKRLKEFATDRVIRNKMANLFVLDVAVEGGPAEVAAIQVQFATPPTPGSFFIHNKAAVLSGIEAKIGAGDVVADWEMLTIVLAVGAGVSQEYLGLPRTGTKAGALVGTEPDIKTFEDYQEIMEQFFLQDAERVIQRAIELRRLPEGIKVRIEITYPAIAEENRSEKMKDIAFAESMSWITHRRSSEMAAKELRITAYDYDDEQESIVEEDVQAQIKFNAAYAQQIKGQPAGGEGGKGMPPSGGGAAALPGGEEGSEGASPTGTESAKEDGGVGETLREAEAKEHGGDGILSEPLRKPGWNGEDPVEAAGRIQREATDFRLKKRKTKLSRKKYAKMSPDKRRDQMDLGSVTKSRRALHGHYNETETKEGAFGVTDGEKIQDPKPKFENVFAGEGQFSDDPFALPSKKKKKAEVRLIRP